MHESSRTLESLVEMVVVPRTPCHGLFQEPW